MSSGFNVHLEKPLRQGVIAFMAAAILAITLSSQTALAYKLSGIIWANQPSPGNCCARLNVQYRSQNSLSATTWDNGRNAWKASPAYIVIGTTSSSSITVGETNRSDVSWSGLTVS